MLVAHNRYTQLLAQYKTVVSPTLLQENTCLKLTQWIINFKIIDEQTKIISIREVKWISIDLQRKTRTKFDYNSNTYC